MMFKYYAGIGSRQTPLSILSLMTNLATKLEKQGWVLRSGGAQGADTAFSSGCVEKQIFVPWNGFQGQQLVFPIPSEAYTIASTIHPGWTRLNQGAQSLMARNCMQLLGPNLNNPVKMVLCWTLDGMEKESERSSKSGGTGQAIAHASRLGIPVYNLFRKERFDTLTNWNQK
jgi:hypothetical protein